MLSQEYKDNIDKEAAKFNIPIIWNQAVKEAIHAGKISDIYKKIPVFTDIIKNITDGKYFEQNPDIMFHFTVESGGKYDFISVKKGMTIYKGYNLFVKPEDETIYDSISPHIPYAMWFGDLHIAADMMLTMNGGVNAYKTKKDLKFISMTDKMIELLYNIAQNIYKQTNNEIYAEQISYFSMIYGIGISIGERLKKIREYSDPRGKRPLLLYSKAFEETNVTLYRGLTEYNKKYYVWGHGHAEKNLLTFLLLIVQKLGFDGIYRAQEFSPFANKFGDNGARTRELIISSDVHHTLLERDTSNKYDWMSWKKYLEFDTDKLLILHLDLSPFNVNHVITKFYMNNMYQKIEPPKDNVELRVAIYNLHGFIPISLYDIGNKFVDSITRLISDHNIDVIGFVEFIPERIDINYLLEKFSVIGLKYTSYNPEKKSMNVVFSRHKLFHNYVFKLPNEYHTYRNCVSFRIDKPGYVNFRFALTHLEIGDRFHHLDPDSPERKQIITKNTNNRNNQLENIMEKVSPDILFGDFNFSSSDDEFTFVTKSYTTDISKINYTVPFGTIVDFIFFKKDGPQLEFANRAIKNNISDHLPVISFINKHG